MRIACALLVALVLSGCGVPGVAIDFRLTTPTPTPIRSHAYVVATAAPLVPSVAASVSPVPSALATPTSAVLPVVLPPSTTTVLSPTLALVVRPTPTLAPLSEAARGRIYDAVWQTVSDQYLYPDFNGVNWTTSRATYRPRSLAAATSAEFYATLERMIADLDDGHSRFVSPQVSVEEQHISDGSEAYVGVGVIVVPSGKHAVITTVFPNSPAAAAGLRRRDRVLQINGKPWNESPNGLRGPVGDSVVVKVQAPGALPRDVELHFGPVNARFVPESHLLAGTNVGYLLIPTLWSEAMAQDVENELVHLASSQKLAGLVVDLRGNGGGWRDVLEGILQDFVQGTVGTFYNRGHDYPLTIVSNRVTPLLRNVPVAVLVDRSTESYAEVLAAVLQAECHAKVVGVHSAGNTETIYAHDFEDGSRLWLAQEGFKLSNGKTLEGVGVQPDVVVDVNWLEYSEVIDPQIQQALTIIGAKR